MIEVRFEKRAGLSAPWVRRILSQALKAEKQKMDLDVLVTGDKQIRRINKKFLKHDHATDVISFGLGDQGDLVISVDTALSASKELGIPFKEEVARYLVHGTLHLLGYDDKRPADFRRMHLRQEAILRKIL